MTTIKDLPYELFYHIIILLVQSLGGAEEFARIIAVCRDFLLYAKDKSILRVVNFDTKIEPVNFYRFQNVRGLLVKCSEAGNEAAQHVLGKVILLSSTHLFLSDLQHVRSGVAYYDLPVLNRWIPDTNVHALNNKVSSFITYFSPTQVDTSDFSQTRLVYYQLVKLFLLNGSHHDFAEMGPFLKYCIEYFMGVGRVNCPLPLPATIELLYKCSLSLRSMEKLTKTKESFDDYFRDVRDKKLDGNSGEMAAESILLFEHYFWKCATVGVHWREALSDMNFFEEVREDMSNQLNKKYTEFGIVRAETFYQFECMFG